MPLHEPNSPPIDTSVPRVIRLRTFSKAHGMDGSTHPDSIAAAIAVEPGIVTKASDYYVDVETARGIATGYCLVDSVRRSGREPNARVIEEIDEDLFFQTMLGVLS